MLLLLVTLHVDAFAEACGASHPASLFETAEPCAAAVLSEGEDSVASSGLELVEEQDFAEGPEGRACLPACLLRAPRLMRPLPDSGPTPVAACYRHTSRTDASTACRLLRAHYSLYCVYRI